MRLCSSPLSRVALAAAATLLSTACADDGVELASTADDDAALWTASGPNALYRVTDEFQSREALLTAIDGLSGSQIDIDAMATAPGGHWIVVANRQAHCSTGFPAAARSAVLDLLAAGQTIRAIDFNAAGGWVVVGSGGRRTGGTLPAGLLTRLTRYDDNGWTVRDVDITNTGFVILGTAGQVDYASIDADLVNVLEDRVPSKRTIQVVDIDFEGDWAVVSDQEVASEGITDRLADRLRAMAKEERMVSRFMLGLGDNYVVYSHGQAMPHLDRTIDRLEYDLGANSKTIWQRMEEAKIPGLSIALVENNRITHARGYGVLRAGQQRNVLASTPFDLASMSKFPSALTIVRLHELRFLDLDDNIFGDPANKVRDTIWPTIAEWARRGDTPPRPLGVPNIDLPARITLRQLLTHRASIDPEGGSPSATPSNWNRLPLNLVDELFGFRCSGIFEGCNFDADKVVWTTGAQPGGAPQYANGNFLLAEAVVNDATGTRGSDRLKHVIIENLGLRNTSADAPLPAAFEARAAWQHGQDGPTLVRRLYPWTFAGGLYASAADYANMMVMALDKGRDANGVKRIGDDAIAEMLRGDYERGLGLFFNGGPASEGTDRTFHHGGRHSEQTRAQMCGNPTQDDGIVILTNSDAPTNTPADPDRDVVGKVINDILDAYLEAKGWPAGICR